MALVECVPNCSEGRDKQKIEQILAVIRGVEGVELLDVDPGAETNRTVVTFVGSPEAASRAAFLAIKRAAEVIDMRKHKGAHPRHGATDVCPFVPVADISMQECAALAKALARRVGDELGIPVYLYDQAAQVPERRSLADVRAGEYEALPKKLGKPGWKPDFGPDAWNDKVAASGVVTIGAREFLIAYNVNLNSTSKAHADDIAHAIREKGRALRRGQTNAFYTSGALVKYQPGKQVWPSAYDEFVGKSFDELERHYRDALGRDLRAELVLFGRDPDDPASLEGVNVMVKGRFDECRAVGWVIPEYNRAQISINLTNTNVTTTHAVYEACRELAAERGLTVTGSEIVGLVPYAALRQTGEFYLERQGGSRGVPDSDVLECAVQSLGLRDVAPFDIDKSVLGRPARGGPLVSMRVDALADEVSRASPAPGGGSLAALAGSLGAALACMVANLTHGKPRLAEHAAEMEDLAVRGQRLKDELLVAVDADTEAFNAVLTAMRLPRDTPEQRTAREAAIQEGYKQATRVPLRTAELCLAAMELCLPAAERGLPASVTDAGVGALLARAGVRGAVDNVRINLGSIKDGGWVTEQKATLASLCARADELERQVRAVVDAALESAGA